MFGSRVHVSRVDFFIFLGLESSGVGVLILACLPIAMFVSVLCSVMQNADIPMVA